MKVSIRKIRVLLAVAVWLLAGLPADAAGGADRSKLDKVLREALKRAPQTRSVIIQARPGSRAALKKALQAHGDIVEADHPSLDALTVTLHGEDLAALEADPRVRAISVDAEVTSFGSKGRQGSDQSPKGDLLRVTLGLNVLPYYGRGVNVAIVDSGIEPTSDLRRSIAGFWDYTARRGGGQGRTYDDYGHGTHVAGLIASSGLESLLRLAGVAPAVQLYGFKVLDKDGRGRVSDVVRALEFIVANRLSHAPGAFKIDVINLSLGHPIYEPAESDPLVRAVENAVRAGIIVVTAAGNVGSDRDGNGGYAGITSPGNAPSAITVGAVDTQDTQDVSDDRVAYFSSRGPTWFDGHAKPDLVAAGVSLTANAPRHALLYNKYPQLKSSGSSGRGSFGTLSGTSMAAAVTTGVVSMLIEASRSANEGQALTPNAAKAVLQFTALPVSDAAGQPYDALTQGSGEINARGAVALATRINTRMQVGDNWLRVTDGAPVTLLGGRLLPWSQRLIWQDTIVQGGGLLDRYLAQWAENIVWGTGLSCAPADPTCENIVWGTAVDLENIVWGTAVEWAGNIVWGNRIVGMIAGDENIVWGTLDGLGKENIVWGTFDGENIVWGTLARRTSGGEPVWGVVDDENIVWGTFRASLENIVWGTFRSGLENIVWGTAFDSSTTLKGAR